MIFTYTPRDSSGEEHAGGGQGAVSHLSMASGGCQHPLL
jgi:hypothetical protein